MAAVGLLCVLFGFISPVFVDGNVSCLNQKGQPVDWFVVYKLPWIHKSPHPLVREGLGHYYLDSENHKWTMGERSLNSSGHAIYYTLQQIYTQHSSENLMYMMYNDQQPDQKVSLNHGHTKGDIIFDQTSGVWLVHSLPHFPPIGNTSYSWPHSGRDYGQTFLCMTLPYEALELIAQQLMYTYPKVYDFNLPQKFATAFPTLSAVIQRDHVTSPPWNNVVILKTMGGTKFTSFAKFTDFDADLYDAWLGPHFQSEMLVESWQKGVGKLSSNCTAQYKVLNIQDVEVGDDSFKETKDHAKWTVTLNPTVHAICIGGINREEHQKKRAGGTVCTTVKWLWDVFNSTITQTEDCH